MRPHNSLLLVILQYECLFSGFDADWNDVFVRRDWAAPAIAVGAIGVVGIIEVDFNLAVRAEMRFEIAATAVGVDTRRCILEGQEEPVLPRLPEQRQRHFLAADRNRDLPGSDIGALLTVGSVHD